LRRDNPNFQPRAVILPRSLWEQFDQKHQQLIIAHNRSIPRSSQPQRRVNTHQAFYEDGPSPEDFTTPLFIPESTPDMSHSEYLDSTYNHSSPAEVPDFDPGDIRAVMSVHNTLYKPLTPHPAVSLPPTSNDSVIEIDGHLYWQMNNHH
jgi:hypothetical protein